MPEGKTTNVTQYRVEPDQPTVTIANKYEDSIETAILEILEFLKWATYSGLSEVDSINPKCALRPALKRLERQGKIKSAFWTPLPGGTWEKACGRVRRKIWFLSKYNYEYVRQFESSDQSAW
jgi:hypothetical protein